MADPGPAVLVRLSGVHRAHRGASCAGGRDGQYVPRAHVDLASERSEQRCAAARLVPCLRMTWTGRSAGLEFTQLRPGLQRYLATHRELTLEGLLADPPLRTGSLDVGYAGLALLCLMVHDVAGLSDVRTLAKSGECRPDTRCRVPSGRGTSGSPAGPGDSSVEGEYCFAAVRSTATPASWRPAWSPSSSRHATIGTSPIRSTTTSTSLPATRRDPSCVCAPAGSEPHRASGSGRSWKRMTLLVVPWPPSMWNGVRVLIVVHTPRPFQPASGSSMRPSIHFV